MIQNELPLIQNELPLILSMVLQTIGLGITSISDPYIGKAYKKLMTMISLLMLTLLLQNYLNYVLQQPDTVPAGRMLVCTYGYLARPVIILLFAMIADKERGNLPEFILVGVNSAVYIISIFTGLAFSFTENNIFIRGPLGYTCHLISFIMLILLVQRTILEYRRLHVGDTFIPIVLTLTVVAGTIADFAAAQERVISYLTVTMVTACVFFYIWLHLQFVREHEEDLEARQRIRIMISQIQPHFLFNTLSTIQALCMTDPQKAYDTTELFGTYLRQNIVSLTQDEMVPLSKELEHTRIYADIEMIRFPSISVDYQIEDDDYKLPALTIQPLVENAIRHGVRIRKEGRIIVSTRLEENSHVIIISDNGKGFDVHEALSADDTHIGLRNVRGRIVRLCGGTMNVDSVIDKGTVITIRIPVRKEQAVK